MSGAFAPPATGGAANWAAPGAIGSTTPNTANVTTLTATANTIYTPTANQTLTATSTIACNARHVFITSAGAITLTSNPQIAAGANGQKLTITAVTAPTFHGITLAAGNGILQQTTTPQPWPLYNNRSIHLTYFTALGNWLVDDSIPDNAFLGGVATSSTPTAGTSTTQLATTAFVEGAVNPVWSAFTYQNSFADIAGFQAAQFTKARGIVYVRGLSSRAAAGFTSGMVIATLPAGFRPAAKIRFAGDTYTNAVGSTLDIDTSGNILLYYNGTPTGIAVTYQWSFVPA
jgi:hypothetical protein